MEQSATRMVRRWGAVILLLFGIVLFAGSSQAHSVYPGEAHPVVTGNVVSATQTTTELTGGQHAPSLSTAAPLATRTAPCCAAGAATGACCMSAGCVTPLAALADHSAISPSWIWQQAASTILPHSNHDGISAVPSVPPPRFVPVLTYG